MADLGEGTESVSKVFAATHKIVRGNNTKGSIWVNELKLTNGLQFMHHFLRLWNIAYNECAKQYRCWAPLILSENTQLVSPTPGPTQYLLVISASKIPRSRTDSVKGIGIFYALNKQLQKIVYRMWRAKTHLPKITENLFSLLVGSANN